MPPAKRVKRRRRAAAPATSVTATPGTTLEEAWDEIKRLRAELDRIRVGRGLPRFRHLDLDVSSDATFFHSCGFEPHLIWLVCGFTSSASVANVGVGCAIADDETDGGVAQSSYAIRRSAGGQFRQQSLTVAGFTLAGDDVGADGLVTVESFDPDGFTYSVTSAANIGLARGFAVGY